MLRVISCLTTQHDWRLVLLAAAVCFLTSFAAINLFHRSCATTGRTRLLWLITTGAATGYGIWATHFIAMLAFTPGVATGYDLLLTVSSLIAAAVITGAGLALAAMSGARWAAPAGGAVVGLGIAVMHYMGMWAFEVPGHIVWSADLVGMSIVLGGVFGVGALYVAANSSGPRPTLIAALLLTLAIVAHHFTAMGAATITADPTVAVTALSLSTNALSVTIASAAVAVLGISLVAAFAGSSRQQLIEKSEAEIARQHERLETALANMSQGLCMFDADQRVVVANTRYAEMYALSPEQLKPGTTLREILEARVANGIYGPIEAKEFVETGIASFREKVSEILHLADGRFISVLRRPMPGGGWSPRTRTSPSSAAPKPGSPTWRITTSLTDLPNRRCCASGSSRRPQPCGRAGGAWRSSARPRPLQGGQRYARPSASATRCSRPSPSGCAAAVSGTGHGRASRRRRVRHRAEIGGADLRQRRAGERGYSRRSASRSSSTGTSLVIGTSIGIASRSRDGDDGRRAAARMPTLRSTGPRARAAAPTASSSRRWTTACRRGCSSRATCATRSHEDSSQLHLPAARQPGARRDLRRRGAAALEPSRARACAARRVHSAGRGNGPDRADRRMGAAAGLRRGGALARRISRSPSTSRPLQFKRRAISREVVLGTALAAAGMPPSRLELEITESVLLAGQQEAASHDAHAAARPRRAHRARRLRHRLLLAELPAQVPLRQDQDRPQLRRDLSAANADALAIVRSVASWAPASAWRPRPRASRRGSSSTSCAPRAARRCRATTSARRARPRRSSG